MKGLWRKRKLLAIVLLAIIAVIIGRLFLNAPIPHIQIAAETVVHKVFGFWNITNTEIAAWIAMVILVLGAWLATHRYKEVPGRWQGLVEAGLEWFLSLVESVAGKANGRRFFPLVATLFLFILIANWISLVPIFGSIGKIEPAYDIIAENEVVQKSAPGVEHAVEEFKAGHITEQQLDQRMVADLQDAGRKDPAVDAALNSTRFKVFDKAGGARLLPIGYNIKKEMTAKEYIDQLAAGQFPAGKQAGELVPYLRGMNTDLNSTLGMAILAMIMVQYWGIRANGASSYMGRFFNPKWLLKGPMGLVQVFVGALEGISQLLQIISLSFRLFGNMLAGEILIVSFVFLIPLLFSLLGFSLELIVGFMQAIVFAALALLWSTLAVTSHEEEEHGGKQAEHAKE